MSYNMVVLVLATLFGWTRMRRRSRFSFRRFLTNLCR